MTYPFTNVEHRTDSDFVIMDDEEHQLYQKLSQVFGSSFDVPHGLRTPFLSWRCKKIVLLLVKREKVGY